MKSTKEIIQAKAIEQDLGYLNCFQLLDALRDVERIRKNLEDSASPMKVELLRYADHCYKISARFAIN